MRHDGGAINEGNMKAGQRMCMAACAVKFGCCTIEKPDTAAPGRSGLSRPTREAASGPAKWETAFTGRDETGLMGCFGMVDY